MPDSHERRNDLETAVLHRMAAAVPSIAPALSGLRVASREYTGVGTFTNFEAVADGLPWDRDIGIDVPIEIPGLEHGLCAVLFCRGDSPIFLELVSFGEPWDGAIDGFQLES
jgi:hypothetical protein